MNIDINENGVIVITLDELEKVVIQCKRRCILEVNDARLTWDGTSNIVEVASSPVGVTFPINDNSYKSMRT